MKSALNHGLNLNEIIQHLTLFSEAELACFVFPHESVKDFAVYQAGAFEKYFNQLLSDIGDSIEEEDKYKLFKIVAGAIQCHRCSEIETERLSFERIALASKFAKAKNRRQVQTVFGSGGSSHLSVIQQKVLSFTGEDWACFHYSLEMSTEQNPLSFLSLKDYLLQQEALISDSDMVLTCLSRDEQQQFINVLQSHHKAQLEADEYIRALLTQKRNKWQANITESQFTIEINPNGFTGSLKIPQKRIESQLLFKAQESFQRSQERFLQRFDADIIIQGLLCLDILAY